MKVVYVYNNKEYKDVRAVAKQLKKEHGIVLNTAEPCRKESYTDEVYLYALNQYWNPIGVTVKEDKEKKQLFLDLGGTLL